MALNPSKSETILLGTSAKRRTFPVPNHVVVAGTQIQLSDCIKLLGVYIDNNLTLDNHVSRICQTAYFHIKALRRLRPVLTVGLANEVATAIVGSRLDYCNSLFHGISDNNIKKLQRVQNTLARIVTETPRFEHITPVLSDLHWLPVSSRVNYKLGLLTYKILVSRQPDYLSPLITPYVPARALRSTDTLTLNVPSVAVARSNFARRSFAYAAPQFWNALPPELRLQDGSYAPFSFGRKLKTHLFRTAYRR
jgi:hypothetical protein